MTEEQTTPQPEHGAEPRPERILDVESLKALAHPLRTKLLDRLSTYGPATASMLGEAMGESSGATSYHLRQLAKHGFIREDEERGTGRERWWIRVPGGIRLDVPEHMEDSAAMDASMLLLRQWHANHQALLEDFTFHGLERVGRAWIESSTLSTASVRLTKEQLGEFVQAYMAFLDEFLARYRDQGEVPGSRPVQVQFNAFPVTDGVEVPAPATESPEEER